MISEAVQKVSEVIAARTIFSAENIGSLHLWHKKIGNSCDVISGPIFLSGVTVRLLQACGREYDNKLILVAVFMEMLLVGRFITIEGNL